MQQACCYYCRNITDLFTKMEGTDYFECPHCYSLYQVCAGQTNQVHFHRVDIVYCPKCATHVPTPPQSCDFWVINNQAESKGRYHREINPKIYSVIFSQKDALTGLKKRIFPLSYDNNLLLIDSSGIYRVYDQMALGEKPKMVIKNHRINISVKQILSTRMNIFALTGQNDLKLYDFRNILNDQINAKNIAGNVSIFNIDKSHQLVYYCSLKELFVYEISSGKCTKLNYKPYDNLDITSIHISDRYLTLICKELNKDISYLILYDTVTLRQRKIDLGSVDHKGITLSLSDELIAFSTGTKTVYHGMLRGVLQDIGSLHKNEVDHPVIDTKIIGDSIYLLTTETLEKHDFTNFIHGAGSHKVRVSSPEPHSLSVSIDYQSISYVERDISRNKDYVIHYCDAFLTEKGNTGSFSGDDIRRLWINGRLVLLIRDGRDWYLQLEVFDEI